MKIKNVTIGKNGAFDIVVPRRKNSKGQTVRVSALAFRWKECKQGKHLNRGIVTDIQQVHRDLGTIKLNS
uniref:Integrase n=1 Tax=Romanomermis culicivorax TaxID=13658 RepID=A0A915L330_ROMCU